MFYGPGEFIAGLFLIGMGFILGWTLGRDYGDVRGFAAGWMAHKTTGPNRHDAD